MAAVELSPRPALYHFVLCRVAQKCSGCVASPSVVEHDIDLILSVVALALISVHGRGIRCFHSVGCWTDQLTLVGWTSVSASQHVCAIIVRRASLLVRQLCSGAFPNHHPATTFTRPVLHLGLIVHCVNGWQHRWSNVAVGQYRRCNTHAIQTIARVVALGVRRCRVPKMMFLQGNLM